MGTQFWWFFDAVVISVAIGFIYTAAAKGFNKCVFRLAGFVMAMVVGFFGSSALQNFVYRTIFHAPIEEAITAVVSDPEWDVFQEASEQLAISASDDSSPASEDFERIFQEVSAGQTGTIYPDWFVNSVCDVTEAALLKHRKPHATERMAILYNTEHDYSGFCRVVDALHTHEDKTKQAVSSIEETLYRPGYLHMIRMALVLIMAAAILLVFGIISSMAGNLEEQMHLGKSNHVLGVLVGIVETAGILLLFIAAVQLIITMTDGQMLVFNPETIEETKVFRYLYHVIPW